ncbi:hypothetical protein [Aeromonas salmonicida]|uniref:hypothetical protein n=1 Tax=Aeromonas salmonicida TaxID=645 RepID=UPI00125EC30A|nr:hypothetical protein [Aeromonas salmonicida]MCE9935086.1 hypothetical protein [Aeromonas salmonicida]
MTHKIVQNAIIFIGFLLKEMLPWGLVDSSSKSKIAAHRLVSRIHMLRCGISWGEDDVGFILGLFGCMAKGRWAY